MNALDAGAKRVHYVERQRLDAADLRAAQDYLGALDRRHDVHLHADGVARTDASDRSPALRGEGVDGPAQRTIVQLGPRGPLDRTGFLVGTTDAAGAMSPRLRIDRDGVMRLWGTVAFEDAGNVGLDALACAPPAVAQPSSPLPGIGAVPAAAGGTAAQMRVNLGLLQTDEAVVRFAIGARADDGAFVPWVATTGAGTLAVGTAFPAPRTARTSVRVTRGTIQQPPLDADPTDPQFLDLMVLARMHGVQATVAAKTDVAVAFEDLPGSLVAGAPFAYAVRVANGGLVPVTVEKVLEVRTVGAAVLVTNVFDATATIDPQASRAFGVAHGGDTPAGALSIEVVVCGAVANAPWWQSYRTTAPLGVTAT